MKKILFIFSILSLGYACGEPEVEFTMPDEDLIKLLYDLQVAESALQTVHSSHKDSVMGVYYEQIFDLHGIDQEILLENIEALKKSPIKSHKIYKKVLEHHKEFVKKRK